MIKYPTDITLQTWIVNNMMYALEIETLAHFSYAISIYLPESSLLA